MPTGHPGTRQHGTISGYTGGCREECCMEAMRLYTRQRRALLARLQRARQRRRPS